eukprot:Clim_evm31s77 gene=Clim_evmTU31s77
MPVKDMTAKTAKYKVLFDFDAQEEGDLGLKVGEIVEIISKQDRSGNHQWWTVRNRKGNEGIVPYNYIQAVAGDDDDGPVESDDDSDSSGVDDQFTECSSTAGGNPASSGLNQYPRPPSHGNGFTETAEDLRVALLEHRAQQPPLSPTKEEPEPEYEEPKRKQGNASAKAAAAGVGTVTMAKNLQGGDKGKAQAMRPPPPETPYTPVETPLSEPPSTNSTSPTATPAAAIALSSAHSRQVTQLGEPTLNGTATSSATAGSFAGKHGAAIAGTTAVAAGAAVATDSSDAASSKSPVYDAPAYSDGGAPPSYRENLDASAYLEVDGKAAAAEAGTSKAGLARQNTTSARMRDSPYDRIETGKVRRWTTGTEAKSSAQNFYTTNEFLKVTVSGPIKEKKLMKTKSYFNIVSSTNIKTYTSREMNAQRDLSDALMLRSMLLEEHFNRVIPPEPYKGKRGFGGGDEYEAQRIVRSMAIYLNRIAKHPILRESKAVKLFLGGTRSEWKLEKKRFKPAVYRPGPAAEAGVLYGDLLGLQTRLELNEKNWSALRKRFSKVKSAHNGTDPMTGFADTLEVMAQSSTPEARGGTDSMRKVAALLREGPQRDKEQYKLEDALIGIQIKEIKHHQVAAMELIKRAETAESSMLHYQNQKSLQVQKLKRENPRAGDPMNGTTGLRATAQPTSLDKKEIKEEQKQQAKIRKMEKELDTIVMNLNHWTKHADEIRATSLTELYAFLQRNDQEIQRFMGHFVELRVDYIKKQLDAWSHIADDIAPDDDE